MTGRPASSGLLFRRRWMGQPGSQMARMRFMDVACGVVDLKEQFRGALAAASRLTRVEPRHLNIFKLRRQPPLVVGRGATTRRTSAQEGLALGGGGANQQADGAARLGGELQAAKRDVVDPARPGQHGGHMLTAQRLVESPPLVGFTLRMHDDETRQIDSPGCGGGGIETLVAIDNHDRTAFVLSLGAAAKASRLAPAPGESTSHSTSEPRKNPSRGRRRSSGGTPVEKVSAAVRPAPAGKL